MKKSDVIKQILDNAIHTADTGIGSGWAPSNVALCKYWGKCDSELNLPVTSSLSVTLGHKGTFTTIKHTETADRYIVNGEPIDEKTPFTLRLENFLDLFRGRGEYYAVTITSNVPFAAGFASSACGFASLVQALKQFYTWDLSKQELSILARLGSGSACRSIDLGFVEWQRGVREDGMDSYALPLPYIWQDLRIGMLCISSQEKAISSRRAMQLTVETAARYAMWPKQVAQDMESLKSALHDQDFMLLGEVAERNAILMHNLMLEATPAIDYSLPVTKEIKNKILEMRKGGVAVFFTQDAGPNLQLLFLAKDQGAILWVFPQLEIVAPFADKSVPEVILVNDNDEELGVCEKLVVHAQGKLHRAFSVMVLRKYNSKIKVLLQKRSSNKYHSANLWSNACCGHPVRGENIRDAASKRLREEMGFCVSLTPIGKFHYTTNFSDINLSENEIDHVFIGWSGGEEIAFNPNEVQDYRWVVLDALQQELLHYPKRYTVWLPQVVRLLQKTLV